MNEKRQTRDRGKNLLSTGETTHEAQPRNKHDHYTEMLPIQVLISLSLADTVIFISYLVDLIRSCFGIELSFETLVTFILIVLLKFYSCLGKSKPWMVGGVYWARLRAGYG